MAGRHLAEAELARNRCDASLVIGIAEIVQKHDGDGIDTVIARSRERRARGAFIEGLLLVPVGGDAPGDLANPLVEHLGFDDVAVEQLRAGLVADAKRIREAVVDDENDAVALALEQRIGGDRGAHLDGADQLRRNALALGDAHLVPDPLHGRVLVGLGVLREQLVAADPAPGGARHHVGERAAAVNPEIPLAARAHGSIRSVRLPDHARV